MVSEEKIPNQKEITQQEVVNYLEQNPDFFVAQEALLATMNFAHAGQAISIFHRQIDLLREQIAGNNEKYRQLAQQAVKNEQLLIKFRQLWVGIIKQGTIVEIQTALKEQMELIFGLKLCMLLLNNAPKKPSDFIELLSKKVKHKEVACSCLSKKDRDIISAQLDEFQGDEAQLHLQSTAILKLGNKGFCIIGSDDVNHFNADLNTLFLEITADIIAASVGRVDVVS